MDSLGIRHAHFCGVSLGSMVGQWLALHCPERIERLVLCNTAAYLGPAELWNNRIEAVRQGGMA
ncbi:MAG: alpha/beta fold hydrolase, partial [Rhodoplanes sp.]